MINTPDKHDIKQNVGIHPFFQMLILFSLLIGLVMVGFFVASAIITAKYGANTMTDVMAYNISNAHALNGLWILQIVSTTIPLFITPIFFAWVIVREPHEYLRDTPKFPLVLLGIAFIIMFFSMPLIELLSNINQSMVFPHFLKAVEDWMRSTEASAQKAQDAMLKMNTLGDMFFVLAVVAFLTAIAEEFMFRGCLQTIFVKWTKNQHAAVWITAFLFSAFHFEFFGFLPRMMLGVLFGYFVVYSGSIWPAVVGHFVNNGTDVVITYLSQHKKININPDDQHVFNYAGYIISLIIILFLFWVYRNIALGKKQVLL
ncbi:CPBP family intramembrane glutamic endopeptidase [Mucilaginibacter sp. L196]|uniref:CPBP family intramembrane glutamic endopeptidase n=1 Tax=Mucilaginibacter sp. L196 TaxID=1641870 RepID=UPI00131C599B|nr:type II CAAX endopeptidase family protein [Mucilaginibacter sp. L196]